MLSLYVSYKDFIRVRMVLKSELDVTQFHNGVLVRKKMTLYVKAFWKNCRDCVQSQR